MPDDGPLADDDTAIEITTRHGCLTLDVPSPDWPTSVLLERLENCFYIVMTSSIQRVSPGDVTLRLTDDMEVQALNAQFRGRDKPTNVLSFPDGEKTDGTTYHGDIVLAWETCAREAAEKGIDVADHCAHLAIHGLLHLFGYDHQTESEAAVMERLETMMLAQLGIADPYDETISGAHHG